MSDDVFGLHCPSLPTATLVGFRGKERLSQPFEFDVFFTVPLGTGVRSAIGSEGSLTVSREPGTATMAWHGLFVNFRLLHQSDERALYHGLLVPKLWLLRHHARSHVQTKKAQTVEDVTRTPLVGGGLTECVDFEFELNGSYPEEAFVCQYRENHLDFVHRWFEREGIYYYFDHDASTSGTPIMRIVDERRTFTPLLGDGVVRYIPLADGDASQGTDAFNELNFDMRLLPASISIVDHNYANPAARVNSNKPIQPSGRGTLQEYGYRVFDSNEAERLAQVKAQSIGCQSLVLRAKGGYLGLRPGYDFELESGPEGYPSRFHAVEVRHEGVLGAHSEEVARHTGLRTARTYEVEITAIPQDTQFRTAQVTEWPRIYGYEHGTVDGPADSAYAQIDDQGRYLVRFHFDTANLADGSTSTYLRMMQPHGGNPEGFHFPLRKGTEVMLSFLGGDPDRPVIASVAPDAHRPSLVTSKNHTQNVIRTGGENHIVIEDKEGEKSIDIYTPEEKTNLYMGEPRAESLHKPAATQQGAFAKESVLCSFYVGTNGTAGFNVGESWWQTIGGEYFVDVAGETVVHYGSEYTLNVDCDAKLFYNAKLESTIKSGWEDKVESGGWKQEVKGGWEQDIKGGWKQEILGPWKQELTGNWAQEIKGNWTQETVGEVKIAATAKITLEAPEVKIEATSIHGHIEPHKYEIVGLIEEAIGHKIEACGAEEKLVGSTFEAVVMENSAHITRHGIHMNEVEEKLTHLETAVTKLENKPTTIVNSVTFIKNTAILVIS